MGIEGIMQALSGADLPLVTVDGRGTITWSNSAAAKFLGPRATATSLLGLIVPDDIEQVVGTTGPATVRLTPIENTDPHGERGIECLVIPLNRAGTQPEQRLFLLLLQRNAPEILPLLAREDFLATVAHDLKNPLGAIFSYADGLLDTVAGDGLSDHHRNIIGRMRATALRSIDLVRNYQQLSQLRAGRVQPPTAPTDLNAVVSAVLEYCWRPDAGSPSLSLKLAPLGTPVLVDRLALERIVSNLVSNAVKYTPAGGSIVIETARLDSGGKLIVSNTGAGIRGEERDSIFSRFTRGSASSGTTGSGLGLYIVKSILDTVGARVELLSEPDKNTTFTVFFPR